jgi:hypothetical protein
MAIVTQIRAVSDYLLHSTDNMKCNISLRSEVQIAVTAWMTLRLSGFHCVVMFVAASKACFAVHPNKSNILTNAQSPSSHP